MTGWTAIVPIKPPAERKTRLAGVLDEDARIALTDRMLGYVLGVLAGCEAIDDIAVLSPERPEGWAGRLIVDEGRGLNTELAAVARAHPARLLIIHADLPTLEAEDVAALLASPRAAAADRHGTGTNALALLRADGFPFAFGVGSLDHHVTAGATLVRRAGLAHDIDTPQDLALLSRSC